MLREARHDMTVVHAPPVGSGEVHAEVTRRQRRLRSEVLVALRVLVEVVHAEQERVDRRPLEPERRDLQHGIGHGSRLRLRKIRSASPTSSATISAAGCRRVTAPTDWPAYSARAATG